MFRKALIHLILVTAIAGLVAMPGEAALKYFRAQHWIVGTVDDALDTTTPEGRTVILYNPADPGNYAESVVGLSGPAGAANTYMLNAYAIPSDIFTWEANITLEARVPISGDTYGAGPVSVETTTDGVDLAEVMTLESLGTAPQILEVRFDDVPYVPFTSNIINPTPDITAYIFINDVVAYVASVEVSVDGVPRYAGTDESWWEQTNEVTFEYSSTEALAAGERVISIKAISDSDTYDEEVMTVTVGGQGEAEVIGETLAYPAPFHPTGGQPAIIAYNLTADTDVTIFMYDVTGQVVWTRKFGSGAGGGRMGYNGVTFDGHLDTGGIVPNGVYIFKIVSGRKVLSSGKLVVHE